MHSSTSNNKTFAMLVPRVPWLPRPVLAAMAGLAASAVLCGCAKMSSGQGNNNNVIVCVDETECPPDMTCQGNICVPAQGDSGVLDAAPPQGRIQVFPDPVQFGFAPLHLETVREVTIANSGEGPLTVISVTLHEDDLLEEFSMEIADATPFVIPQGSSVVIQVTLRPEDGELDAGTLEVSSDDPTNPSVSVTLESAYKGTPTLDQCVLDEDVVNPQPFVNCVLDPVNLEPLIDYAVVSFGTPVSAVVAIRNGADGNAPLLVEGTTVQSGTPAIAADFTVRLFTYDTDQVTEIEVTPPVWLGAGDLAQSLPPDLLFAEVIFGANVDGVVSNTRLVVSTNDPAGKPVPISAAVSGCPADYWDINGDDADGCEYHCVYQGPEQCASGADENCNGVQDEEGASGCTWYYRDGDGDGYGITSDRHCYCQPDLVNHYSATQGGDCDDANNLIHPNATEVCDGLDNDCDGPADEDLGSTTCGLGVCLHTVPNCLNGVPQACDAMQGSSAEICDGLDNDCDGQTDDGLGNTTCGQGVCLHTVPNCSNGTPQFCNPFEGSGVEACDGLDNDCDGQTDEGLGTTSCGQGQCAKTVQNCVNGVPQTCDPMAGSTTEVCDTFDNDCDGQTDEGLGSTTCGQGVCLHTIQNCVNGVPQTCNPLQGAGTEICDSLDNDCDGETDEMRLTDVNNCGSCGNTCTNDHGTTLCVNGFCTPTCSGLWRSCNGDPDDGCETAINTLTNCGACSTPCSVANGTPTCTTGSCAVSSCNYGYCDQNGLPSDGCERDLDMDPACGSYTNLGTVRGDTGGDTLSWSGNGERWFQIYVAEAESSPTSCVYLSATIQLTPAAGTDYDLYVYCDNCTTSAGSSANGGSTMDQVLIRWDEACILGFPSGSDSGRYVYINVRYFSANTCGNYGLNIYGNTSVGSNTCSTK